MLISEEKDKEIFVLIFLIYIYKICIYILCVEKKK